MGVLVYTLLVGKNPYDQSDSNITYRNLKNSNFLYSPEADDLPFGDEAKDLMARMLHSDPHKRPNLDMILQHPFITNGEKIPSTLPTTTLFSTPVANSSSKKSISHISTLRPLIDQSYTISLTPRERNSSAKKLTSSEKKKLQIQKIAKNTTTPSFKDSSKSTTNLNSGSSAKTGSTQSHFFDSTSTNIYLGMSATEKKHRMDYILQSGKTDDSDITVNLHKTRFIQEDTYVKEWIDDPTNPGLVYVLSNGAVGILFHDTTQMVVDPRKMDFVYIRKKYEKSDMIKRYTLFHYPVDLREKVSVLIKFMKELVKDSLDLSSNSSSGRESELIYVKRMLKTNHATMFRMNKNLFQVIFADKTELLFNYDHRIITYRDKDGTKTQHPLETALDSSNKSMIKRLKYTTNVLADVSEKKKLEKINSCADFLATE